MEGDRGSKLFYKTFRGLSTAKQIPELVDQNGNVTSTGDGMAQEVTDFFKQGLGTGAGLPDRNAPVDILDPFLEDYPDKLTWAEKIRLNGPFSLQELGEAAAGMKKAKCPGPDRIPAELFQVLWPLVGPLLLLVINNGLERECFSEKLTLGLIVLLPKKGDQSRLTREID